MSAIEMPVSKHVEWHAVDLMLFLALKNIAKSCLHQPHGNSVATCEQLEGKRWVYSPSPKTRPCQCTNRKPL